MEESSKDQCRMQTPCRTPGLPSLCIAPRRREHKNLQNRRTKIKRMKQLATAYKRRNMCDDEFPVKAYKNSSPTCHVWSSPKKSRDIAAGATEGKIMRASDDSQKTGQASRARRSDVTNVCTCRKQTTRRPTEKLRSPYERHERSYGSAEPDTFRIN